MGGPQGETPRTDSPDEASSMSDSSGATPEELRPELTGIRMTGSRVTHGIPFELPQAAETKDSSVQGDDLGTLSDSGRLGADTDGGSVEVKGEK